MKPTKVVMLVGLAAVSFGVAMANARNLTPGSGLASYFEEQKRALPALVNSHPTSGLTSFEKSYSSGHDGTAPPYYFDDLVTGRGF